MIHRLCIPVSCDAPYCHPETVYYPVSPLSETTNVPRARIEQWLVEEQHWIVRDGSYYCGQVCANHVGPDAPA
jgi:hypothetical protein